MTNYSRARDEYLETEVLTAGPVRRVQMMYEALVDALAKAKDAQATGNIAARAHQVNRATAILTELAVSLDHSQGGKLSRELVELYDYAMRRLLEGSVAKKVEPFAEVERIVRTLQEAWNAVPEIESAASVRLVKMGADQAAGHVEDVGLVGSGINHLG